MKVKDLKTVLWDRPWSITWCVLWDGENARELSRSCNATHVIDVYGEYAVTRITADDGYVVIHVKED